MNKFRLFSTLPLLASLLAAGCAGAASKPAGAPAEARRRNIVVLGELTDNGLGCTALRTSDGTLYTLARDLEGSEKGDRLRVEGYVVPNQGCAIGVSVMPMRATSLTGTGAPLAAPSGR